MENNVPRVLIIRTDRIGHVVLSTPANEVCAAGRILND